MESHKDDKKRKLSLMRSSSKKDMVSTIYRSSPEDSMESVEQVQTTLTLLLSAAYDNLFPSRSISVEYSFNDGVFCTDYDGTEITDDDCEALRKEMIKMIYPELKIQLTAVSRQELKDYFHQRGWNDKLQLMKTLRDDPIKVVKVGNNYMDYYIQTPTFDSERLMVFEVRKHHRGILLRFPLMKNSKELLPFKDSPILYNFIEEYSHWTNIVGCRTISQINDHIATQKIHDIKWLSEGLHNQKIFTITSKIQETFPQKRVIALAGPSSSNKTTLSLRLSLSLRVLGFNTVVLSLDDYYLPIQKIPIDEHGDPNFEVIDSLDLEALGEDLNHLFEGKEIAKRKNFFDGRGGVPSDTLIKLAANDIIILEGIHGVNPQVVNMIGADKTHRIFVAPFNLLHIDRHHYIRNSDCRLIRRMVRDYKFRHKGAEGTLEMWEGVRYSEEINIFPFLSDCDFIFNTSLIYELPVLSKYVKILLYEIGEDNKFFNKVKKLIFITNLFYEFDDDKKVPGISFLREFIGDSDFDY